MTPQICDFEPDAVKLRSRSHDVQRVNNSDHALFLDRAVIAMDRVDHVRAPGQP